MDDALSVTPDDLELRRQAKLIGELAGRMPPPVELPENAGGRLKFTSVYDRTHHRSGWSYAMAALQRLHSSRGVRFEGFLEDPFAWQHPRGGKRSPTDLLEAIRNPDYATRITSEERGVIPYRETWVGFVHNPPNMPRWFHGDESPQAIFAKSVWRESLEYCAGLFTLSEYSAEWLREATGKPVSSLLAPTEPSAECFSFERFRENQNKRIVQVGWWLRQLTAIDRLPIPADNAVGYQKLRLVPNFASNSAQYLDELRAREDAATGSASAEYAENTFHREHVPNDEYDALLANNICFVHLYDASANNAVIECLARATPLLVNRLPAVEEYLGSDYPFYYRDLDEAAAMALDLGRVRSAHEYLAQHPTRDRLNGESFLASFRDSEVYRLL